MMEVFIVVVVMIREIFFLINGKQINSKRKSDENSSNRKIDDSFKRNSDDQKFNVSEFHCFIGLHRTKCAFHCDKKIRINWIFLKEIKYCLRHKVLCFVLL